MTHPTPTLVRHPYQAGRGPRRLYLAGQAALVGAVAALAAACALLWAVQTAAALAALAVGLGLSVLARWLRTRAWFSVAWAHQDGTAEPAWVTSTSRGVQLALVVGMLVSGLVIGTAWSAAWSFLASAAFATITVHRAARARRDGLSGPLRAWRIIDAVTVSLTCAGVVVYLGTAVPGAWLALGVGVILTGATTLAVSMSFAPRRG